MKLLIKTSNTCIQAPSELMLKVKKTSKVSSVLSFLSSAYIFPQSNLKLFKGESELSPSFNISELCPEDPLTLITIFPLKLFNSLKNEIENGSNESFLHHFLKACDEGFSMDKLIDEQGWGLVHFASLAGNLSAVTNLIVSNEKNANLVSQDGWTPLMIAAEKGHVDIVLFLLEDPQAKSRVKVNKKTRQGSALHKAVQSKHVEIVKILIKHRADIKIEDFNNRTCMEVETSQEILEIIPKFSGMLEAFKGFRLSPVDQFEFKANRVGKRFRRDYKCSIRVNFKDGRFEERDSNGKLLFKKKMIKLAKVELCSFPLNNEKFYFKLVFVQDVLKFWVSSQQKRAVLIENLKKAAHFCKWSEIGIRNYQTLETLKSKKSLLDETETKHVKSVRLSEFEKVKQLGSGSFGKVYLIQHKFTSELFALKTTDREINSIKEKSKYAIAECEILKSVNSKFIVKLFWAIATRKHLHLILEFCPGSDLSKILEIKKVLNESETRFVLASVILALKHLHLKNIICRDLKPANVLIDQTGYFKLCDFGLSQNHVEGEKMNAKLMGSPSYLSPEGISNNKVGKSADIWALGIMTFQMLSGEMPFHGKDYDSLYDEIIKKEVKFPAHVSHTAKSFLKLLIDKNPKTRPKIEEVMEHPLFEGLDWGLYNNKKYESPAFFQDYLKRLK
jgi:hypothetical protein